MFEISLKLAFKITLSKPNILWNVNVQIVTVYHPDAKENLKFEEATEDIVILTYRWAHCSYLDIYISQKIRLCKGDFEGKFQFNLQAKSINFLGWKFRSIILMVNLNFLPKKGMDLACRLIWNFPSKSPLQSLIFCEM